MDTKICVRCKKDKNINEFNKNRRSKDGLNSWCRECANKYRNSSNKKHTQFKENLTGEIWRDIKGYEGLYQVSNYGRVKSLPRIKNNRQGSFKTKETILNFSCNSAGYYTAGLWKNKKRKTFQVHRLVAQAFIPNIDKKPIINHKDEDKTNNCVNNLEWCDDKYNNHYGTARERQTKACSKEVFQYTLEGKFVKKYTSTMDAERKTGFKSPNICNCCNGKGKTYKGFIWSYEMR